MGVVYKLKKEVIDFIIDQKQHNPQISCRRLVAVVQETFQIALSKSSVNAIIKSAQLSSPVGRRASPDKPPSEARKKEKPSLPSSDKERNKPMPGQKIGRAEDGGAAVPGSLPNVPKHQRKTAPAQRARRTAQEEPQIIEQVSPSPKGLQDGLGNIFLKAAQWEISGESIVGAFLKDRLKSSAEIDMDVAGEVLLFMSQFGVKNLGGLASYKGTGLWTLSGAEGPVDAGRMEQIIQGISPDKRPSLADIIEIDQLFVEIAEIKMILEDGNEIRVDPGEEGLLFGNVQTGHCLPMNKTIDVIVNKIINNVQSMFLYSGYSDNESPAALLNMCFAFNNLMGKKIAKIFALDGSGEKIADFDTIPDKKRVFLFGVWPGQMLYKRFLDSESVAIIDAIKIPELGWEGYFQEIIISLVYSAEGISSEEHGPKDKLSVKIRGFLLRTDRADAPFLVVASNDIGSLPGQELIKGFLLRWPGFAQEGVEPRRGQQKERTSAQSIPGGKNAGYDAMPLYSKSYELSTFCQLIIERLHAYSQQKFFPEDIRGNDLTSFLSSIYGIPGQVSSGENLLAVSLSIPTNIENSLKDGIEHAAQRINAREIYDYRGRRLKVIIK